MTFMLQESLIQDFRFGFLATIRLLASCPFTMARLADFESAVPFLGSRLLRYARTE